MYLQMIGQPPQGAGMDPSVATEAILNKMNQTKSNVEFLEALSAES
jgi:transcription termination factor Rho